MHYLGKVRIVPTTLLEGTCLYFLEEIRVLCYVALCFLVMINANESDALSRFKRLSRRIYRTGLCQGLNIPLCRTTGLVTEVS